MTYVSLVYEGLSDEMLLLKICRELGLPISNRLPQNGKSNVLNKLDNYNKAARGYGHWVVVVDMDSEAPTANDYVQQLLPTRAERLVLCVAVQAIESWLLADREQLAAYLGIRAEFVPLQPDLEINPKATLLGLVSGRCKKAALKADMLPIEGGTSRVGPGYVNRVAEYVEDWRLGEALQISPSLRACVEQLRTIPG